MSTIEFHVFEPESPSYSRAIKDVQKFLDYNYPVQLPSIAPFHTSKHERQNLVILTAEYSQRIIGASAMILHEANKVHICALAVAEDMQRIGVGTEILKRIAIMYPTHEVTLSITMDETHLLNFYCGKEYARLTEINTDIGIIVLSLIQLNLLRDVPLP
jgi:GNAT superfamily N-acetyltransferase